LMGDVKPYSLTHSLVGHEEGL